MSIDISKASESRQGGAASARDPFRDLVDKLQRSESSVSRADPALGASIRAVAAQVDIPGRTDDAMFRTKVAYALQDVEKLAGPSVKIRMADGLREEMTRLAATSPGLQNERMQALLQGTATLDDRSLVRLIRRDAAMVARAFDQTAPVLQQRIEALENQARSGIQAELAALVPAPATPTMPAAPTPPVMTTAAPVAVATGTAAETVVERQVVDQPTPEQIRQRPGMSPTVAIMAALRKPEPTTPAPWDQQLTPLKDRVARYVATAQANEEEGHMRAAERAGQAAIKALQAFATGPGAGIMDRVQAAAKADPNGAAGVAAEMREGGRYADLRRTFVAEMTREGGFASALDSASAAVRQYGTSRTLAHGIAEARGDAEAVSARFAKMDAEVGKAASEMPGRKPGKSQMEELGEKAAKLASKAIEAVKAAFRRTPSVGQAASPSAAPS